MRLVYFGSGDFGIPTLEALLAGGHEVSAVVTQPDRPAGRGGRCRSTPIKNLAEQHGLPVLTPEKPNTPEFAAELAALAPDLAVVVAYGHLIKKDLLAIPRFGFVNLHASLLPAYRGAAPVPWAILSGETVSGVSVFQLDERFDTGAVIGRAELPIAPDDTSATYLAKLAPLGGRLMAKAVCDIAEGGAVAQPQNDALASKAPKFLKGDGLIDWTCPFAVIERKVRGLQPWPQAHALLQTAKGCLRVNVLKLSPMEWPGDSGPPGRVLAADAKQGLVVATGDGAARLVLLQPEGKRAMTDIDFLRGTCVLMERRFNSASPSL